MPDSAQLARLAVLEFFATNEIVDSLEAELASGPVSDQLGQLVALAWHLRQRDTRRSMALGNEAQSLLSNSPTAATQRLASARLLLIQGESRWLYGDLQASQALAEHALQAFWKLEDALGCADAHWLLAWIANDNGDGVRRDQALAAMLQASEGVDPVRVTIAQATVARFAAFSDPAGAQRRWDTHFANTPLPQHPAAACVIEDFRGILLSNLNSDYAQSIRHHISTYTLALASGQTRRAIITATNLGEAFDDLNDHLAAMDWMRKGLELARVNSWPVSLGNALTQTAGTLRYLQRFDTAHAMLREALELLAPMASSRAYAVALRYLGDVEYDLQDYASALDAFKALGQSAISLGHADLLSHGLLGQARVLLQLNQPQPAMEKAHAALAEARHWTSYQISALRVLADIHARNTALPPRQQYMPPVRLCTTCCALWSLPTPLKTLQCLATCLKNWPGLTPRPGPWTAPTIWQSKPMRRAKRPTAPRPSAAPMRFR